MVRMGESLLHGGLKIGLVNKEARTAVSQLIGELGGREPSVHGERDGPEAGRAQEDLQASRAILKEEGDAVSLLDSHLVKGARGGRDPRLKIGPRQLSIFIDDCEGAWAPLRPPGRPLGDVVMTFLTHGVDGDTGTESGTPWGPKGGSVEAC
jgi:hypothetical protein